MTQDEFNPYVGPRPFERKEEDSARFFGRTQETEEIVALIFGHPVILVYAQSGAGKTSLFNASVATKLEESGFDVLPLTRVGGVVPKGVALEEILNLYIFNTLLKIDSETDSDTDPRTLSSTSLCSFLETRVRRNDENGQPSPRVLILDQFEELFTYTPEHWREQREGFFLQVVEALNADPLLRVVFVIREDFLAELDPYSRILPEHLRIRYRLERLGENAALRAIKDPLRNTRRQFAPGVAEGLVKELLTMKTVDATGKAAEIEGQYVEPVQLQVVCVTLWSTLKSEVTEIQKTHLENFNVNDALSNFYKSAVESATKETGVLEADLRNWFGKILITPMNTRSTVFRGEDATGGIDNRAVDFLESRHIIRAEFRAGARWYELTHDRLVEPIRKSNEAWFEKNSSLLQNQTALWVAHGRPDGMLLRGDQLEKAMLESQSKTVSRDEADFLSACRRVQAQEQREKRLNLFLRSLAFATTIFLIVAVTFAVRADRAAKSADIARQTAEAAVATATYSLGQENLANADAASSREMIEAETLAGKARIALQQSESVDSVRLGQLLSVQAYKINKHAKPNEILPSVYQALFESSLRSNEQPLNETAFSAAAFPSEIGGKWLVVDNLLWTADGSSSDPLDIESDKVIQSSFLSDEEIALVVRNNDYSSSDQNPYIVNTFDLTNRDKTTIFLSIPENAYATDVGLSDDGRWATITYGVFQGQGGAQLWDLANPSQDPALRLLTQGSEAESIIVSSQSNRLALIDNSTLYVYPLKGVSKSSSLQPLYTQALDFGYKAGSLPGRSGQGIQFTPDGQHLAVLTNTLIRLYNTDNGKIVGGASPDNDKVIGYLFSPDSKYLVYVVQGRRGTRVLRWSLQTLKAEPFEFYRSPTSQITAMDMSKDGELVIGDDAGYVRAWNVDQEEISAPRVFSAHSGRITNILIGPDDHTIISASEREGTRMWDLDEGATDAVVIHRISNDISSIAHSQDGKALAIGGINRETDTGNIRVYSNLETPSSLDDIPYEAGAGIDLGHIAISDKWIAAARTYRSSSFGDATYFLDFWKRSADSTSTYAVSFSLNNAATSLVFDPEDKYLAIATRDGQIWLEDTSILSQAVDKGNGGSSSSPLQLVHKANLPSTLGNIESLIFTQDGKYLIAASAEGVWVWDMQDPASRHYASLPNVMYPIAVSTDGKRLVTAGTDNVIQMFDLSNIQAAPQPFVVDASPSQFAFSPEDKWIATATKSGRILIFDFSQAENRSEATYTLNVPGADIASIEFSSQAAPGGQWLVASGGNEVFLWNMDQFDNRPIVIEGSKEKVEYAGFTLDGQWIVTVNKDQTLRHWTMNLEQASNAACSSARRNMRQTEWESYFPKIAYNNENAEICSQYPLEELVAVQVAPTPTPGPTSVFVDAPVPTSTPAEQTVTYTVKEGDTLTSIASQFGIDINTLATINGITNPNEIRIGQILQIKTKSIPVTP